MHHLSNICLYSVAPISYSQCMIRNSCSIAFSWFVWPKKQSPRERLSYLASHKHHNAGWSRGHKVTAPSSPDHQVFCNDNGHDGGPNHQQASIVHYKETYHWWLVPISKKGNHSISLLLRAQSSTLPWGGHYNKKWKTRIVKPSGQLPMIPGTTRA